MLQAFKSSESIDDTYCLLAPATSLDSEGLRRLLLAWPKVRRAETPNKKATVPADTPAHEKWAWLWRFILYSQAEWGAVAGISNCAALVPILVENRLVYPDGTISQMALRIARQVLRERLQGIGTVLKDVDEKEKED